MEEEKEASHCTEKCHQTALYEVDYISIMDTVQKTEVRVSYNTSDLEERGVHSVGIVRHTTQPRRQHLVVCHACRGGGGREETTLLTEQL